jgi:hypothetical protein
LQKGDSKNLPESPAINIFNLPILLPLSVNGLLLGMVISGMMSCGVSNDSCDNTFVVANLGLLEELAAWSLSVSSSERYGPLGGLGGERGELGGSDCGPMMGVKGSERRPGGERES